MIRDPEFGEIEEKVTARPRGWRRFRQVVVYPFLVLAGCRTIATGIPIPLVHLERLDHPSRVVEVGDRALVLEGGRELRLPFIERLPKGDPRFAEALSYGVEIDPEGEAWVLINSHPTCGNDPVILYRHRVNLSGLAGALNPRGIDGSLVSPEEVESIESRAEGFWDNPRRMPRDPRAMSMWVRRFFDEAR